MNKKKFYWAKRKQWFGEKCRITRMEVDYSSSILILLQAVKKSKFLLWWHFDFFFSHYFVFLAYISLCSSLLAMFFFLFASTKETLPNLVSHVEQIEKSVGTKSAPSWNVTIVSRMLSASSRQIESRKVSVPNLRHLETSRQYPGFHLLWDVLQ